MGKEKGGAKREEMMEEEEEKRGGERLIDSIYWLTPPNAFSIKAWVELNLGPKYLNCTYCLPGYALNRSASRTKTVTSPDTGSGHRKW